MKKSRFKIGDWVVTKACATFYVNEARNERKLFRIEREFYGQICGAKYRYTGTIMDNGSNEQASFEDRKSVLVWLVSMGVTNIPVEVLDEDVNIGPSGSLPWRYCSLSWTKENRKEMSEYSKEFPRDAKGRFV